MVRLLQSYTWLNGQLAYQAVSHSEVLSHEELFVLELFEIVDSALESLLFLSEESEVLLLGAGDLIGDAVGKAEVLDVSLKGLELHSVIFEVLIGLLDLSLEALLGLLGHAHLAELVEQLEVGIEGCHVLTDQLIGHSSQDLSLALVRGHVHLLSDVSDPGLLVTGWVSRSHSSLESLRRNHQSSSISIVVGLSVTSQEFEQEFEDSLASGESWADTA